MNTHTFIPDLSALLNTIPEQSILSRTVHDDDYLRVILFRFAAGEELSEHTAAYPVTLHFLSGQATVTLGEETFEAEPGSWARLDTRLPHSVHAHTEVTLLLMMLKGGQA